MTKAVTINLGDAQVTDLERIAVENGVTLEELLSEVVELYAEGRAEPESPPLTAEEEAALDRAIAQADDGQVVSQDEVEARLGARFRR